METMSSRTPKTIVLNMIRDVSNAHNIGALQLYFSDRIVDHTPLPGQKEGLPGFVESFDRFFRAFPDLKVVVQSILAEGDEVAVRLLEGGTHSSEFCGYKPTRRHLEWSELAHFRVQGGQITEFWGYGDLFTKLSELSKTEAD